MVRLEAVTAISQYSCFSSRDSASREQGRAEDIGILVQKTPKIIIILVDISIDPERHREKIEGDDMEEIRCKKCRRLLMKVVNDLASCGIYIKCPKCHYHQHFGSVSEIEEEKNLGRENLGRENPRRT